VPLQPSSIAINGKQYPADRLMLAVASGVTIDFPEKYKDNPEMTKGPNHAFILHDGVMIRVVQGEHATSRKAKLISKVLLKGVIQKTEVDQPLRPFNAPSFRDGNDSYHTRQRPGSYSRNR
jgi:hypothetical protein